MNPRALELALLKQRLQMRAEAERDELLRHLATVDSVLDAADRVHDRIRGSLRWAREQAPLLSVATLVVLAVRPRQTFRLARRAWIGWLLWRRLKGKGGASLKPAVASVLLRLLSRLRAALDGGAPGK
ncbi:YqjK-like family protein [Thauera sinica]|uniref:YqjK-like family protein n=1 Tax=Thauera sinica TaxID=2665146 RepID=A0ABW1ASS6_9RHOO|nr:YqjK-like family protein [Thauera sp. K11]ATE61426.1 hypothetical protein CCZ27_17020 [Thauera sp. K11]